MLFFFLVSHVVEMRSEEQVFVQDAWRVVAAMEYAHPFGDRPVLQLPRDPVGKLPPVVQFGAAVPPWIRSAGPFEAPCGA